MTTENKKNTDLFRKYGRKVRVRLSDCYAYFMLKTVQTRHPHGSSQMKPVHILIFTLALAFLTNTDAMSAERKPTETKVGSVTLLIPTVERSRYAERSLV